MGLSINQSASAKGAKAASSGVSVRWLLKFDMTFTAIARITAKTWRG